MLSRSGGMADAVDSKSAVLTGVRVRVPPSVQRGGNTSVGHYIDGTIEQAEPNGIFASKNSISTWVRCIIDGEEPPIYVEGKVTAYPYPIVVDYDKNRVLRVKDAKPTVTIKNKEK